MFFNAGVATEPGDKYYIDDIKLSAPSALCRSKISRVGYTWAGNRSTKYRASWQLLRADAQLQPEYREQLHRSGMLHQRSGALSTLQAISLSNFDLSVYPQFNIDVLSPAGGGSVRMQLSSPSAGNKAADAAISTPGQWETLSFDFSAHSGITDFQEIRLIFNAGAAAAGESWCIDNLTQSKTTIDPCDGVAPVANIVDDFECQQNYSEIFYGGSDLKTVNNPHLEPGNGSTRVGEYSDPVNQPYAGIGYRFAQPLT
ncbi:MAG: hypothetical protein IPM81_16570 [Saprospirales bacterium]|nr:hypothetical protein [Saprospirales bacterium]